MILPLDWDLPGKDNEALCRQFEKAVFEGSGIQLPYRYFVPRAEGKVPLVIYLHGADAVGDDNELPLSMHDIGTMFSKQGWQSSHPCFILAPQYGRSRHWSIPEVKACVMELILSFIEEHSCIDTDSVYIYGYSAGGVGTLKLVKENANHFAAAISICGATSSEGLEELEKVPLWMVHAADDRIVKASYREAGTHFLSHYGSRDIFEALKDRSPGLHYTEYPAGYMKEAYGVNAHCSWVTVSDPEHSEIREWLFAQRRGSEP